MEGVEAVDEQAVVQQADVQDGGDETVLEAAQAGDEVVGFGGDGDDFDVGAVFLEAAGVAHQGTAGAEAGDEDIHIGEVGYDFLAGAFVMGLGVAFVAVLVQHQVVVGAVGDDVLGHCHAAVSAEGAVGVDDLRAVGGQQLGALYGHIFGHYHGDGVAFETANHRQGDAGVAGGGFQDGAGGGDFAVGFGAFNHLEGDAVLDAAGGVLALQLGVDPHGRVGAEVVQLHQRGVADGSQQPAIGAVGRHKRRLNKGRGTMDGGIAMAMGQRGRPGWAVGSRRRRRLRRGVRGFRPRRRKLRSQ